MNVLNLGYGRNGPLIEYATLREYLPSKVNKIVLMYYAGNDLDDLKYELTSKILNNYLNDENYTQNLRELQNEIDLEARKNIKVRAQGEKFSFLFLNKTRSFFGKIFLSNKNIIKTSSVDDEYLFDQLEKIVFLLKKLSAEKKSQLYIVDLPARRYFKNGSCINGGLGPGIESKNSAKMKKIAQKLEIQYIDIHEEVFQKELNPCKLFPFEKSAHYNVEGYKKVALKIYEKTK